jgi:hypothetical protein
MWKKWYLRLLLPVLASLEKSRIRVHPAVPVPIPIAVLVVKNKNRFM